MAFALLTPSVLHTYVYVRVGYAERKVAFSL